MRNPLRKWKHPTTGEIRVYVNTEGLTAKIWLVRDESSKLLGWQIKYRHEDLTDYPHFMSSQGMKPWEYEVQLAFDDTGLGNNPTWEEILNAAE